MNPVAAGGVLPLLPECAGGPLVWRDGQAVGHETFLAHVAAVAERLPERPFAANLCADRYHFLVAFAAVGLRGQTSLLPTSRVAGAVAEARALHPDSYTLGDADVSAWVEGAASAGARPTPGIPAAHVMAIAFTSGSTGTSQPHPKRWGELVAGAWLAERRFRFAAAGRPTIVATVPPQHMYGLETTILLPLTTGLPLHAGRPFFPDDICAALAAVPAPRVLVTTPAHLRVCVRAKLRWPAVHRIISATAPLPRSLAMACEQAFDTQVVEIYGLTEAGSVASRRTATDDLWTTYDGVVVAGGWITAPHLAQPVRPADILESHGPSRFALAGRQGDLVNIAGKRTSLGYLTQVLLEVEGVEDGTFVRPPDEDADRPQRLLAVVVAPQGRRAEILAQLSRRLDPVFLPRPLLLVDALPRNAAGKLPQAALAGLIAQAHGSGQAPADGRGERCVSADHPALAGHFPGNPIVPGVVVLEEVLLAARAAFGAIELAGLPAVKFLAPLRPDEPFAVRLSPDALDPDQDSAEVSFVCTCDGRTISRGRMVVRRPPSARPAAGSAAT